MTEKNYSVLDGIDLILSLAGNAAGYSTGCKVSTTVETGERVTKETSGGKWKEKYVKTFQEEITVDGLVLTNGDNDIPTYDQLKELMLKGEPIEAQYSLREGSERTGKKEGGYKGKYLITSLELDGQAGDDAKYNAKLENCGKVEKVGTGLTDSTASSTTES
jgi:predicted secreted protein